MDPSPVSRGTCQAADAGTPTTTERTFGSSFYDQIVGERSLTDSGGSVANFGQPLSLLSRKPLLPCRENRKPSLCLLRISKLTIVDHQLLRAVAHFQSNSRDVRDRR